MRNARWWARPLGCAANLPRRLLLAFLPTACPLDRTVLQPAPLRAGPPGGGAPHGGARRPQQPAVADGGGQGRSSSSAGGGH